jgi:hypothetical protein
MIIKTKCKSILIISNSKGKDDILISLFARKIEKSNNKKNK